MAKSGKGTYVTSITSFYAVKTYPECDQNPRSIHMMAKTNELCCLGQMLYVYQIIGHPLASQRLYI